MKSSDQKYFQPEPNLPAVKTDCQIPIDISESRISARIMASFVFSGFIIATGDSCVTEGLFTLSPGYLSLSLSLFIFIFHFFALSLPGWMRSLDLALLLLDGLSPYQMGSECPIYLTKLQSR